MSAIQNPKSKIQNPGVHRSVFAPDPLATERIGESLGRRMEPGTLVLLFGNLGAGKTTFAHGLARGLEIPTDIQSPTFALIYEHKGRIPLAHMDFYRLNAPDELDTLGIEEYLDGDGVTLIEWPEIAMDRMPESRIEIRITPEAMGRRLEFTAHGDAATLLSGWNLESDESESSTGE
ncbi:MAG: tRNA (adenosine(37)-N6)-threonylcarbamoyltransferase complex ATPase subunit type 1 TsaE [Armatimonadetes bacterium]|nr:tRNA (adenosine(37)-N6)-threonylcarbamoyltransferase complex ATPase subunit type 1 TsaE [Armatimonadota bacterium]